MAAWYLAHTKVRQELVAQANLERQGFEVYLPMIAAARRRAGRWLAAVEPLFPGYLFVSLDLGLDNISSIRSTRGVNSLVRFGPELRPVPDAVVDALISAQDGDRQTPIAPAELFRDGDPVCFAEGPLAGMQAIVRGRSGADRVAVLLSLLGREQEVVVSPDSIVPKDLLS